MPHFGAQAGIERREGFVKQEQRWAADERAGEGSALLLSAGELRRVGVGNVGNVQALQPRRDFAAQLAAAGVAPAAVQAEGDVLRDGEMRKEGVILKEIGDVAPRGGQVGRAVVENALADVDMPAIGAVQPGDGLHKQRFAAAAAADDDDARGIRLQAGVKAEAGQGFLYVDVEAAHFTPSRGILPLARVPTASNTATQTAEMSSTMPLASLSRPA